MADFLAELLSSVLGSLVPERAANFVVGVVMLIAGIAFVAMAGFITYQGLASHTALAAALMSPILVGLAAVCFRFMMKGFRSARGSDQITPKSRSRNGT